MLGVGGIEISFSDSNSGAGDVALAVAGIGGSMVDRYEPTLDAFREIGLASEGIGDRLERWGVNAGFCEDCGTITSNDPVGVL